jgi:hypothetical protein
MLLHKVGDKDSIFVLGLFGKNEHDDHFWPILDNQIDALVF